MSAIAVQVRLLDIAHARSGDKGDTANVGVIALRPEWYPLARRATSRATASREHFAGVITGDVVRFELPNLNALNFLLHGALDGGGTLSLKTDAQGKVFSTALLRMVHRRAAPSDARALGLPVARRVTSMDRPDAGEARAAGHGGDLLRRLAAVRAGVDAVRRDRTARGRTARCGFRPRRGTEHGCEADAARCSAGHRRRS